MMDRETHFCNSNQNDETTGDKHNKRCTRAVLFFKCKCYHNQDRCLFLISHFFLRNAAPRFDLGVQPFRIKTLFCDLSYSKHDHLAKCQLAQGGEHEWAVPVLGEKVVSPALSFPSICSWSWSHRTSTNRSCGDGE